MYRLSSAYSFRSPLPLDRMFEAARSAVPWAWCQRENYDYGDYLWASTDVPTSAVRVLEEDGRYLIDVEFRSDLPSAREDCEALHRRVREELLPALLAEDVQPADHHGR